MTTTTEPAKNTLPKELPYYQRVKRTRPKILLIDDERNFTEMLQLNLELTKDYQVVVENNSVDAVATAKRCQPDVILLDAIMPGLDGFEVLSQLEDNVLTQKIPVIFLTAISHELDFPIYQFSEVVQRKTLSKPVRVGELLEAIEEELKQEGEVRQS